MKTQILNRFSPLSLDQAHSLKNRVVVPPMASGTATQDGIATSETVDHYAKLAQSGAGLIIAEYTYVSPSGRSEEHQLGISSDDHILGLAQIAKAIHQSGALAGIQLTHSGGKSSLNLTHGQLMGPSGIQVPVKGEPLEIPSPMTLENIQDWKQSFNSAVGRATKAGFDLVELHAAHGYGLNQWLSPLTNQRSDNYGAGSIGRSLLLREIITEIKHQYPEILISVRIPGQDFIAGGMTTVDATELSKQLEQLGIHIINVSSGIGGWRRPSPRIGQGYLVEEAAIIQSHLSIPVIGVGGIESGEYIDQAIQTHRLSLAAVGRAILKDAHGWYETNLFKKEPILPQ
jgi:NADPH2 dehydrogenase